jgi:hypothetical protein
MTREEAITVLKAFMENPLFSDVHKQAFNIAIHDIKQRHDWDINNLILLNRENLDYVLEQIKSDVLDELRAEIDKIYKREGSSFDCLNALDELKEFIDKYKAESEEA